MQKASRVWWIEREGAGRLGVMTKPTGSHLEEDLRQAKDSGAQEIISLLTTDEVESAKLHGEGEACRAMGMKFKRYGIQDHGVPTMDAGLNDFLKAVYKDLQNGRSIVVHCNTGRGRTGLIAGALMAMEGIDVDEAIHRMRSARHSKMPENEEQEQWLRDFAHQYRPLAKTEPESQGLERLRMALLVGVAGIVGMAAFLGWMKSRRA